ncbi:MFS transporter [Kitasatospora sp. NPDC059571]|uniref:MFS transporter n=1 Tax=Kitasatospora sp. NPDC059571 TaxID=3346871 RepID=UPI0036C86C70
MLLFAAVLVPLLLFLMDPSVGRLPLLAVTAAAAAGLTHRELRAAHPFIDLRVLAGNVPLLATYLRALLTYTVSYAFLYGYTQWLEQGRGLSASQAGLVQLPMFATAILVSTATGRRAEIRGKLLVGAAAQLAACAALLALGPGSGGGLLLAVALLFGIPQGLNGLALQNAVYHQADPQRVGSSAGLLRTFGYLGAIAASSAGGAFFPHRADTAGLHELAWFMLACAGLFLLLTAADRSLGRIGPAAAAA